VVTTDPAVPPTIGAILAGGLARRLGGGDKTLRTVGGRTVLARLIDRLAPQVKRLIINVNNDPDRFGDLHLPIVPDSIPGYHGPLAGVLAALDWVSGAEPAIEFVVTAAGDVPFLPRDLVRRLHAALRRDEAVLACAGSDGRTHPIIALWPVSLRAELRNAVAEEGTRRVDRFTGRYRLAMEQWPTDPADPFFNVNTPEDLAEANRLIAIHPGL
jgi:molybdopterin-guanine dinucleotide biosynthesis protein A